ncbi:MAG: right-handed parallel beta-helix repeat-containing protein [Spirochaetales bacterium]|nr:right-handed parallel beta-helix repeat-containing protein [Spirochaetales bacterium]
MARIGRILPSFLLMVLLAGCEPVDLRNFIEQLSEPDVAVYVCEATGNDANLGDIGAPLKTIQAGIVKAASFIAEGLTDSTRVNVAEGTYQVTDGKENSADYTEGDYINMVEGVSLYGGYAPDFSVRDPSQYISLIVDMSEQGEDSAAVRAYDGLTDATVIDGFTIQGAESTDLTSSTTLDIEGASPRVSNNIIRGGYAAVGGFSLNLDIYDNSAPTIENNTIIGGDALGNTYGIIVAGSSHPVISGNTISGGSSFQTNGILCWESQADIMENTISGGEGTQTHGINLLSGSMVTIKNNIIDGGTATERSTGIYNHSDNNVNIVGNTISGGTSQAGAVGIRNENTGWFSIRNNLVFGGTAGGTSDADGIFCHDASGGIYNNTIAGGVSDYSTAIVMRVNSSPSIENNILFSVSAGSGGCCIGESYGGDYPNNKYADTIRNNALWDPDDAVNIILYKDYVDDYYDTATDVNNHPHGHTDGNVDTDPLFVDIDGPDGDITTMADNDWHLSASSPAGIRTGGLDGIAEGWAFTDDRDGNTRTGNGSTGWSIGAYEQD